MSRLWKKAGMLLGVALAVLAISGCMLIKGSDGKAYVKVYWPSGYYLYTISLSSHTQFPSSITKNVNYAHTAGSYYFQYWLEDTYYYYPTYTASYTVTVNAGKGTLMGPVDGDDKYFTVSCYTNGASVSSIAPVTRKVLEGAPEGSYVEETTVGDTTFRLEVVKSAAGTYNKADAVRQSE